MLLLALEKAEEPEIKMPTSVGSSKKQETSRKTSTSVLLTMPKPLKIMSSGPITSWEIDGETMETESHFILGGSKITADGDCSYEIKR